MSNICCRKFFKFFLEYQTQEPRPEHDRYDIPLPPRHTHKSGHADGRCKPIYGVCRGDPHDIEGYRREFGTLVLSKQLTVILRYSIGPFSAVKRNGRTAGRLAPVGTLRMVAPSRRI